MVRTVLPVLRVLREAGCLFLPGLPMPGVSSGLGLEWLSVMLRELLLNRLLLGVVP